MYNTENNEYKFGKAIPLPSYHHVHQVSDMWRMYIYIKMIVRNIRILRFQRFFTSWCHVYTTPPTLIGTLEGHTLDDIQKQVSNCLMKMYTLCDYIARAGLGEKVRRNTEI